MPAFFISLREGLEAALIVGILLGTLRRLNQRSLSRYVWYGVVAASLVSAAVAAGLTAAGIEFEGRREQLFEGVMLILAAALLTGMIFWMQRRGGQVQAALAAEAGRAVESAGAGKSRGIFPAGAWAMFTVAFVAVVREGIELALLLVATTFQTNTGGAVVAALLGIAVAALFGALLYLGVVRINLRRFFSVTNVVLLFFAAGMVGLGIHELIEAGLVPPLIDPLWDVNGILSDKSAVGALLKGLFGYNGNPALTETLAYVAYIVAIGWALVRTPRRTSAPRGDESTVLSNSVP
jgi:high-affinity iron transporter